MKKKGSKVLALGLSKTDTNNNGHMKILIQLLKESKNRVHCYIGSERNSVKLKTKDNKTLTMSPLNSHFSELYKFIENNNNNNLKFSEIEIKGNLSLFATFTLDIIEDYLKYKVKDKFIYEEFKKTIIELNDVFSLLKTKNYIQDLNQIQQNIEKFKSNDVNKEFTIEPPFYYLIYRINKSIDTILNNFFKNKDLNEPLAISIINLFENCNTKEEALERFQFIKNIFIYNLDNLYKDILIFLQMKKIGKNKILIFEEEHIHSLSHMLLCCGYKNKINEKGNFTAENEPNQKKNLETLKSWINVTRCFLMNDKKTDEKVEEKIEQTENLEE